MVLSFSRIFLKNSLTAETLHNMISVECRNEQKGVRTEKKSGGLAQFSWLPPLFRFTAISLVYIAINSNVPWSINSLPKERMKLWKKIIKLEFTSKLLKSILDTSWTQLHHWLEKKKQQTNKVQQSKNRKSEQSFTLANEQGTVGERTKTNQNKKRSLTGNLFIRLQLSFIVRKYFIPTPRIICGSWAE